MTDVTKPTRPDARLPKGFRDVTGAEIRAQSRMLQTLAKVFETYGYEPLETSAISMQASASDAMLSVPTVSASHCMN